MKKENRIDLMEELRQEVIENNDDLIAARIGYAMETAIRRVTEDVVGWPSLAEDARQTAELLRKEMGIEN